MSLRSLLFLYRHKKACRRLKRLVEDSRNSYETRRFRERRAAALKGLGKA
jgi:hypothetical protein